MSPPGDSLKNPARQSDSTVVARTVSNPFYQPCVVGMFIFPRTVSSAPADTKRRKKGQCVAVTCNPRHRSRGIHHHSSQHSLKMSIISKGFDDFGCGGCFTSGARTSQIVGVDGTFHFESVLEGFPKGPVRTRRVLFLQRARARRSGNVFVVPLQQIWTVDVRGHRNARGEVDISVHNPLHHFLHRMRDGRNNSIHLPRG